MRPMQGSRGDEDILLAGNGAFLVSNRKTTGAHIGDVCLQGSGFTATFQALTMPRLSSRTGALSHFINSVLVSGHLALREQMLASYNFCGRVWRWGNSVHKR